MEKEPKRPYYKQTEPLIVKAIRSVFCRGDRKILQPIVTKAAKSSASREVIEQ